MLDSAISPVLDPFGGGGNVHALADAVGYAADLFAAGIAIRRKEVDVGEEHVAREIAAFKQEAGVIQLRPPAHPATVGGENSCWPRAAVAELKSGTPGMFFEAELFIGRYGEFNRALDVRADRSGAVEIARQEHGFEQRRDFVVVVAKHCAQFLLQFRRQVLADEVSDKFCRRCNRR